VHAPRAIMEAIVITSVLKTVLRILALQVTDLASALKVIMVIDVNIHVWPPVKIAPMAPSVPYALLASMERHVPTTAAVTAAHVIT